MAPRHEEPVETVTFRIPASLKTALEAAAEARNETSTAVLRAALEEHLTARRRRTYELPGFTKVFDDFLARLGEKRGPQHVLFMVEGRDSRYFYDGLLDFTLTVDSLVAVKSGAKTYVIPRAYVVGWHGGDAASVNRLAIALTKIGWACVTLNQYLPVPELSG